MTTRRKFFGWMAASPLAAKAAGDQAVAELMKSNISGFSSTSSAGRYSFAGSIKETELPIEDRLSRCVNYIKMFGLPKDVEETYRKESKTVWALDFDIANKKSWSLAVKIMTQRQRNYQKRIDSLGIEAKRLGGLSAIRKALGFEFPTWY